MLAVDEFNEVRVIVPELIEQVGKVARLVPVSTYAQVVDDVVILTVDGKVIIILPEDVIESNVVIVNVYVV